MHGHLVIKTHIIVTLFPLLLLHATFGLDNSLGMFENFEATSKLFRTEQALVASLRHLRSDLHSLLNALETSNTSAILSPLLTLQRSLTALRWQMRSANLPSYPSDYQLALRGLLLLRDTYQLDLSAMIRGELVSPFIKEEGAGRVQLDLMDLSNLAQEASNNRWMDTAVMFVKMASLQLKKLNGSVEIEPKFMDNLEKQRKNTVETHNALLKKRKNCLGADFKTFPYTLDVSNLTKSANQPSFAKKLRPLERKKNDFNEYVTGSELKLEAMRRICRDELVGSNIKREMANLKCHYLHHDDHFLKLAPFKYEILLHDPFRAIFHDILSEQEIDWLINHSGPKLSRENVGFEGNKDVKRYDTSEKRVKTLTKSVQCWLKDIDFEEKVVMTKQREMLPLKEPYAHKTIHPILVRLSLKLELATQMRILGRFASTQYQVTNYGLSGFVESHVDPHGYLEGVLVPDEKQELLLTGDMVATFMAWLNDVESGGKTAFDAIDFEQNLQPEKGSAAFWIDLNSAGQREKASSHAGCPVLKGSKWILNKWIYYFDQFKKVPCGLEHFQVPKPFLRTY